MHASLPVFAHKTKHFAAINVISQAIHSRHMKIPAMNRHPFQLSNFNHVKENKCLYQVWPSPEQHVYTAAFLTVIVHKPVLNLICIYILIITWFNTSNNIFSDYLLITFLRNQFSWCQCIFYLIWVTSNADLIFKLHQMYPNIHYMTQRQKPYGYNTKETKYHQTNHRERFYSEQCLCNYRLFKN